MTDDSNSKLKKGISKGIMWVSFSMIVTRFIGMISAIILARLLSPSDFGIMAIVMSIFALTQGTTITGFESALIQKRGDIKEFLNTAWTFGLARYLILFLIVFFTAPIFAIFLSEPKIIPLLRTVSFTMIFSGLRNIGIVYFRKELDFKKQFQLDTIPFLINVLSIIPLAFALRNVWALVIAHIIFSLTTVLFSYALHPYRPKFELNTKKAKELFHFGKWILGNSLIGMIKEHGLSLFFAKLLGVKILGYFNRANAFSVKQFQYLVIVIWKVGFPAYSKLNNDLQNLKKVYLKTLKIILAFCTPIIAVCFLLSYDFTHIFLTDKWILIVPLLKIFFLYSFILMIASPSEILFQAIGKPGIGTKLSLIEIAILIIGIYPVTINWGINGAAYFLLFSAFISAFISLVLANRILKCNIYNMISVSGLGILTTILMIIIMIILKKHVFIQISVVNFFALSIITLSGYLMIGFVFDKVFKQGVYLEVKNIIKHIIDKNH